MKQNIFGEVTWELLYLRMRQLRWHGDCNNFPETLAHVMLKYGHKYYFFLGSFLVFSVCFFALSGKMTIICLYL